MQLKLDIQLKHVKDMMINLDTWDANNFKIITWINFIEHSIGTQLAKYETAKEV